MQHWLRGGRSEDSDDDTAEALRSAGMPEHLIPRVCNPPADFPLLPENELTVRVWLAIGDTQWNAVGTMAGIGWVGLRYEALPAVMDMMAVPADARAEVFAGLRVMESVARREMNRRQER